jgi:PEP-CTERM motif
LWEYCLGFLLRSQSFGEISLRLPLTGLKGKELLRKLSILAACFVFSMAVASAANVDYTLTSGDDVITFSLPQPPAITPCSFRDSCFGTSPTDLVVNGMLISDASVNFYTDAELGGLTILDGSTLLVNNGGTELFSGTLLAPTLKTFTNLQLGGYSFGSPVLNEAFTLNAVLNPPATAPEPAAAALILAGAGVAALINRRRMSARSMVSN